MSTRAIGARRSLKGMDEQVIGGGSMGGCQAARRINYFPVRVGALATLAHHPTEIAPSTRQALFDDSIRPFANHPVCRRPRGRSRARRDGGGGRRRDICGRGAESPCQPLWEVPRRCHGEGGLVACLSGGAPRRRRQRAGDRAGEAGGEPASRRGGVCRRPGADAPGWKALGGRDQEPQRVGDAGCPMAGRRRSRRRACRAGRAAADHGC